MDLAQPGLLFLTSNLTGSLMALERQERYFSVYFSSDGALFGKTTGGLQGLTIKLGGGQGFAV